MMKRPAVELEKDSTVKHVLTIWPRVLEPHLISMAHRLPSNQPRSSGGRRIMLVTSLSPSLGQIRRHVSRKLGHLEAWHEHIAQPRNSTSTANDCLAAEFKHSKTTKLAIVTYYSNF